jgi:tRNA(Ile)-lysidine synthase
MEVIMPQPRGLLQQFDQMLHHRRILPRQARILVGCSGGADSVALLRLLHGVNQGSFWQWQLIVAHVNHNLRGLESNADQAFTRQLARQLHLPFRVKNLQLKSISGPKISENAARKARLAALGRMATAARCSYIALAHHADDQAETVLMRLIRGTGVRGMAGMATSRPLGTMRLVRPLLSFPRQALREYLEAVGQPWQTDRTNIDRQFLRNRIRHELIPLLADYQPNIRRTLVRLAENARIADQAITKEANRLIAFVTQQRHTGAYRLAIPPLIGSSIAAVAMVLRHIIIAAGGRADQIHHNQLLAAVRAVRRRAVGTSLQFSRGVVLTIHGDEITVRRPRARSDRPHR